MNRTLTVTIVIGALSALSISLNAEHSKAQTYVLQGEKGEKGDPGDKGEQGETGDASLQCSDNTCTLAGNRDLIVEGQIIAAPSDCPQGYRRADSSDEPTGVVLCQRRAGDPLGSRYDEMVKVGDFWIDRYEISLWSDSSCSGVHYAAEGTSSSPDTPYPEDFPPSGNWSRKVYACSMREELPSRWITWFQAQQACELAGKHLCTNAQWQAAVAGTNDPQDSSADGQCLVSGSAPRQSGRAGSAPGGDYSCISNWGAEDMIGNVWEWTSLWTVAGKEPEGMKDNQIFISWPDNYGYDATYNLSGRAFDGTEYKDGLPAALIRGGTYDSITAAGSFSLSASYAPSASGEKIGARCCRIR